MEQRESSKFPSDDKDSCNFTLLCDFKKATTDKQTPPQDLQHRVPPICSLSDVVTPNKLDMYHMDLFSPYKEDQAPTVMTTPRHKRRASDSHTTLTPGISELLPTHAKRSRLSAESDRDDVEGSLALSPMKSLTQEDDTDVEMNASQVFANSPGSPSSECKAMMDEIDVSPAEDKTGEDFLRRQSKGNIRKCRSMEIRKKLIDMTNTSPYAFKKSLFKKPALPMPDILSPVSKDIKQNSPSAAEGTSNELEEDEDVESAAHLRIKEAVDVLQTQGLIADGSRHYCLPLVKGKHTDLQNIDHETMAQLVSNGYPNLFDKLTVIDCRYPYEYNGGHIKGSINIYTEEAMVEFLNNEVQDSARQSQTHILVFHCEFSSQRGPSLLRHLRNCDRRINLHQYPQLAFPEIYCLFGGYKEFFAFHPELCEPSSYIPMVDEKYASDLRHFRAKAKSWAAGERLRMKHNYHQHH